MGKSMFNLAIVEPLFDSIFISDKNQVRKELFDIDSRLTPEFFIEVVSAALLKIHDTKSHYFPKFTFNKILPDYIVALMREKLLPFGWISREGRGEIAYTITPNRCSALYVCTGTKDVAVEYACPCNTARKGSELSKALLQSELYFDHKTKIFVLLFHHDSEELKMELSIPADFKNGYVKAWEKRILLPSISFNSVSDRLIARIPDPVKAEKIEISRKR